MIYNIISWAVFGLIVGAIARILVPGKQPMGWTLTMILGIVGSFVGGGISYVLFRPGDNSGINPAGWILSIIGAVLVVVVSGWVATKQAKSG